MADAKKSRSAIRTKSSERKKSANKADRGKGGNPQEEEVKESLAYKVISEDQTNALKELTPRELEAKLAEILNLTNYHISLPEACVLDYYVAGFWFTKEENFNNQQTSAFFTLLKILVENIKDKHMSLAESLVEFKRLLVGIGMENCPKSGGLECFDISQAKVITNYFTDSLFQHFKLYEFLFTQEPSEEVITTEVKVEVPPMADIPFPPPLDEGMTEDLWREYIMTPPTTPEPETNDEAGENEEVSKEKGKTDEIAKDILTTIKPEHIKTIIRKTADGIFENFKIEVETKLKERENNYAAKITKR
ncbi:ciliary-associated calcium-binding coiled-coil protein 1-like isoform X2 [Actinia tenebrosa]|uniref:Ciliary-associated calcium-binding coiled-coil protein 1-like isoform X2 n=1 Tax=Actinia tenebrosa TaxID=6105 RepID=A0A6P8IDC8_ACTTE|nr:ciliary-associated calcium-binding coiled-coil protein 1-like isoform X2 [Actinia tenebrosa]